MLEEVMRYAEMARTATESGGSLIIIICLVLGELIGLPPAPPVLYAGFRITKWTLGLARTATKWTLGLAWTATKRTLGLAWTATILICLALMIGLGLLLYAVVHAISALFGIAWRRVSSFGDDRNFENKKYTDFTPEAQRPQRLPKSLQAVLTNLVDNELDMPKDELTDVLRISREVAEVLRGRLHYECMQFDFPEEPELIGSTSDGTRIPGHGDCDYLLQMELRHNVRQESTSTRKTWYSLYDHGEGYWRLRVHNPFKSMKKVTLEIEDDFGKVRYYISPLEVHRLLVGRVTKEIERVEEIRDVVCVRHVSSQAGPAIKLEITYDCKRTYTSRSFDMDFVPCITVNGMQHVGKRHPSLPDQHQITKPFRKDPSTLRWRQSFSLAERDRIRPLDRIDGGCRKELYRVVKYLRSNHPQFRQFSSFIYKTVFLYLLDEVEDESTYADESEEDEGEDEDDYADEDELWSIENLAARFTGYMKMLEQSFKAGEIYHYYLLKNEEMFRNLLKPDYSPLQITEFYNFLHDLNVKGESAWARLIENVNLKLKQA